MSSPIKAREFDQTVTLLRAFFKKKNFIEVHTQSRLSILAACEDPSTIATFNYAGDVWPLPQTGQMWLEHELLNDPDAPGFFCVSTSYRQEPNPIPGRHDLIFPMCEFEIKGGLDELKKLEMELLEDIGFGKQADFKSGDYLDVAKKYGVEDISGDIEKKIEEDYGPVFFLERFPEYTSPFWNMKRDGEISQKIDVILHGIETIGSAERSCDPDEMRKSFMEISDGRYAEILFGHFGKDRVLKELDEFLSYDFFPRSGGGIGATRMIRALKLSGLIEASE